MLKTLFVLIFSITLLFSNIAYVQNVEGEVYLIRDNKLLEPSIDMLINQNDMFSTRSDGSIVIEFDDNMILSAGNNSDFKLSTPLRLSRGIFSIKTKKQIYLDTDIGLIGTKNSVSYYNILPNESKIALISGDSNITQKLINKEISLKQGELITLQSMENIQNTQSFRCEELDGIDTLDCDQDGIEGVKDLCQNTPLGFLIDKQGCASSYTLGSYFNPNSSEILFEGDNISKLQKIVSYLNENVNVDIVVENYYIDNIDKDISNTRARKVYTAIKVMGIDTDRIKFRGIKDSSKKDGITIIKFIRR